MAGSASRTSSSWPSRGTFTEHLRGRRLAAAVRPVGNGDELHDLRRDVRLAWWREHGVQVEGAGSRQWRRRSPAGPRAETVHLRSCQRRWPLLPRCEPLAQPSRKARAQPQGRACASALRKPTRAAWKRRGEAGPLPVRRQCAATHRAGLSIPASCGSSSTCTEVSTKSRPPGFAAINGICCGSLQTSRPKESE